MKRVYEMVKPFFSIIFGALLLLVYLNALNGAGGALAFGIIGVVLGAFYICKGIAVVLFSEKFSNNARAGLEVAGVVLYPLFVGASSIYVIININAAFGPTAWVIYILGVATSFIFALAYLGSRFTNNTSLKNVATLFGLSFGLYLVLDLLFNANGNVVQIGDLSIVALILRALYIYFMIEGIIADPRFEFAPKKAVEEPAAYEEAKPEEPKEEDSEEPSKDEPEEPNPEEEPKEE